MGGLMFFPWDCSRVTRLAGARGKAVIFKNHRPKYLLIDMDKEDYIDLTDNEKLDVVATRIWKCILFKCNTKNK